MTGSGLFGAFAGGVLAAEIAKALPAVGLAALGLAMTAFALIGCIKIARKPLWHDIELR